ncbi:MAG: hypothetical protein R3E79_27505 [Caldilineaceae bacterium]
MGRQRQIVVGLHLTTLLLLALHLYVRTLPSTPTPIPDPTDAEAAWWGLWPVTYAPGWAVRLGAVLIGGWIVGWWVMEVGRRSEPITAQHIIGLHLPHVPRNTQHLILGFAAVLLFCAFYAFPLVHTRWGDAYLLTKAIAWPDPALRLTHSWQAPLDVFLHSQLWLYLHEAMGWEDAMPLYRLLSPLAGLFYLMAALGVAREQQAPVWLTFGLVTSLGVLQLFFGYVENYSFAAAALLLYLWLGLRTLAGRTPLWITATVLAITHALHPSTIILAPSLLYCGWQHVRCATNQQMRGNKFGARYVLFKGLSPELSTRLSTALIIALPMAVVALVVVFLMEAGGHGLAALVSSDRPGGGDARLFVPLWTTTTRWEHYTMFSWLHLRDFVNEQLLVAPVVLPGLVVLWFAKGIQKGNRRQAMNRDMGEVQTVHRPSSIVHRQLSFIQIAALCYLFFIWVWNADYGGQRDWDLFSLAAIPAALWLAVTLPGCLSNRRYLQAGTIPLLMLQWLHLAAWIYQNTLPWEWPS